MLQAGGIDTLVDQKADAYRSNPQALQQRYSQNQELMDLLAMQKLKTEKETVARDMALKAQQTPGTIAEQYEQQLVAMNKDQMTQQTAGVLGQKQKQAQQKQQAMGIPPQQPQGPRPPMPQGAPQGIAGQPRPNMQGMASGGIVGYQEGGLTSISDADVIAFLQEKYGDMLTGAQLKAILADPERISSEKESMMQDAARTRAAGEITGSGRSANQKRTARSTELLGMPTSAPENVATGLATLAPKPPITGAPATGAPATGAPATGAPKPDGGLGDIMAQVGVDKGSLAMGEQPTSSPTQVSDAVGKPVTDLIASQIAASPEDARKKELGEASDFYRRDASDKKRTSATDALKALDDAQMSPENLKAQQDRSMILGTIKGGRLGGGLEALENTRTNQGAARRKRLEQFRENINADIKADFDTASKIGEQGVAIYGRVADARTAAMNSSIALSDADVTAVKQDAALFMDKFKTEIDAKLTAAGILTKQEMEGAIAKASDLNSLDNLSLKITAAKTALLEMVMKNESPEITMLRKKRDGGEDLSDPEKEMLFRADAVGTKISDVLDSQQEQVAARVAAISGVTFKGVKSPVEGDEDPDLDAAMAANK